MSKTQIGFKGISPQMKDDIIEVMNIIADRYLSPGEIRGNALHKLCMLYNEKFASLTFKEIPESVPKTIHAVQCEYLRWDGEISVFMCYESYHKSHKKHPIDSKHDKVLDACRLCKKGKSDAIRYRIEEGFRKKGINNVFNLTKLLLRMDVEGAVAQVFLCQAKQFTDDEIIISPDCTHLKCPNLDNELVLIEEYCIKQIDPESMNPPCKWLIAPFLRVPIKPAPEAKAVMEEMKRLADESNIEEPPQAPIEVESKIIGIRADKEIENNNGVEPIPIEEVEPIPIEEVEPEPIEEVESNAVDLENPQTARDIIAKENEEKAQKKLKD